MFFKRIFAVLILSVFVFLAFNSGKVRAISCDANVEGKTNAELQDILNQCDRDIIEQKAILIKTQKQSSDLEKGIAEITYNINKTQIEINARNAKIKQLGENITTKTQYIGELSVRMENIKKSVSKMIRESYNLSNISLIEIALSSQDLSDLFKDIDNYATIDRQLNDLTHELTNTKKTSETEKIDLQNRQTQEEKLKFEQDAEKRQLEVYKKEKQSILVATKGQESAYKKIIADKEKLKNQISNRLFRTVGGQELTFGEALKIIKPYESTIGVSSALVLAILTQETSVDGLIGKNIGKCYYNQSAKNTNGTVMSKTQIPSFLAIMSELGYDENKTPVSCPIYSDGEYGGAMGPAQFMPSTWWNIGTATGYKNRVGAVVGVSLPDPFKSRDAFVGTALYIKDAQAICKTAFTKKTDIWACSASKYYGGLSLKGSRLSTYMYSKYGYGKQVADRAAQFEKDIDTLSL